VDTLGCTPPALLRTETLHVCKATTKPGPRLQQDGILECPQGE
jgi:hypothetical protein